MSEQVGLTGGLTNRRVLTSEQPTRLSGDRLSLAEDSCHCLIFEPSHLPIMLPEAIVLNWDEKDGIFVQTLVHPVYFASAPIAGVPCMDRLG